MARSLMSVKSSVGYNINDKRMKPDKLRLIRLVCGIVCLMSGIVTLAIAIWFISGNTGLLYAGVVSVAMGAIFIGFSLKK